MSESLLSEDEASDYIGGAAANTMRGWRTRGTGPRYVRVGRRVRYRREDLDAWLAERTVTPGGESVEP